MTFIGNKPASVNTSDIVDDVVTYAKLQNVTTTDRLLGRSTAGSGDVEEIICTAAGRAILDDADAAAQCTTLGAMGRSAVTDLEMNNYKIHEIKTATFNSQIIAPTTGSPATSGTINIDWTAAQNYKQNEPTGAITYTFTAPPGPCHLQLLIDSDGNSTAQAITWPTLTWIGATWAGVNNKKAIINFWYDGTNYFAMGGNQV
jgi:hypothetical protein